MIVDESFLLHEIEITPLTIAKCKLISSESLNNHEYWAEVFEDIYPYTKGERLIINVKNIIKSFRWTKQDF